MPIEVESPEQIGYNKIDYNLSESSVTDAHLQDLHITFENLVLAYSDHLGKPELRALVAAEGVRLTPGDVLITVGAASALFIVNSVLLKPGDHMIVAFPNYVTNIETPRAIGCKVDTLKLEFESGYHLDFERLAALMTRQTRLVSLTCPHNPTGSMMTEAELRQAIELVESRGCYLLFDETYREMSFSPPLPRAASLSSHVISVSSLSKTYGLPGIRLGWLICRDQQLMETFLAAKEQIFITNSVVDEEIAYRFLLDKGTHLQRVKTHINANFAVIKSWMGSQSKLEWIEPSGGVVCFPRIKADVALEIDDFYRLLLERYKTFVGPGHWFESDRRHMRIGYGWPSADALTTGLQNVTLAIEAAEALVNELPANTQR
jgi:aspartate/methionine/tyrosine aminotransferase